MPQPTHSPAGSSTVSLSRPTAVCEKKVDCCVLLRFVYLLIPGGSDDKESACSAGDLGSIPGLGKPMEEEMATPSSIIAWRIPMDRGAWWATVHSFAKGRTQLSD